MSCKRKHQRISERSGYTEIAPGVSPVSKDLDALVAKHGLDGAVLIAFDFATGRYGATGCGTDDGIMKYMDALAEANHH